MLEIQKYTKIKDITYLTEIINQYVLLGFLYKNLAINTFYLSQIWK